MSPRAGAGIRCWGIFACHNRERLVSSFLVDKKRRSTPRHWRTTQAEYHGLQAAGNSASTTDRRSSSIAEAHSPNRARRHADLAFLRLLFPSLFCSHFFSMVVAFRFDLRRHRVVSGGRRPPREAARDTRQAAHRQSHRSRRRAGPTTGRAGRAASIAKSPYASRW